MAEANDDLEQLKYLQSLYAQEYDALLNEISGYTVTANAVESNIQALENLNTINNANLLLNLEAGTYIEVKTQQVKGVIAYVGAGYLVEKSFEEAKSFLSKNKEKNQEALKMLFGQAQKLEKELIDLGYKIDAAQRA